MRKYTDEQLKKAVEKSTSIRETLKRLDVIPAGGNYFTFHSNVKRLNLDISHFDRGQKNRKIPLSSPPSLDSLLILGDSSKNQTIKKLLFKEGLKKRVCEYCRLEKWMGKPIPLELEHVNGNNSDNRIENLKIICPNCHALTPTYRGRNIKLKREKSGKVLVKDKKALNNRKFLSKKPDYEILLVSLINSSWNFEDVGTIFEVSGTSIRRWCKDFGLPSNQLSIQTFQMSNYKENNGLNLKYPKGKHPRLDSKRPSRELLIDTLISLNWNFVHMGSHFGISDNAVRKWCKKYNLPSNRKEIKEYKENFMI